MKYRSDIDGLRAIAVIPIVLFHAGIPFFNGGFVGVDIFFVISGFLITSLILRDLDNQSFSFKEFWLRRIRRILPASFVAIIVAVIAFSFVAPPASFSSFADSLMAQSVFSPNILFWRNTGYFASNSELEPLLHTWSLAVEEQFYFIFPLLLFLLTKHFHRRRLPVLIALAFISFALSIWGSMIRPSAAFYLLPFRAWELGIGGILAFFITYHREKLSGHLSNQIFSLSGLVGIFLAIAYFDKETPFPSYTAALPCLGTAFIIWANRSKQTLVGRLLSTSLLRFIGKISYSLYLWHWTILVFNKYIHFAPPSIQSNGLALMVSLFLSYLSYKYVENPFRRKTDLFDAKFLVKFLALSCLAYIFIGLTIHLKEGLPSRFGKDFVDYSQTAKIFDSAKFCHQNDFICRPQHYSPNPKDNIFVWGDSHGRAILPAVLKAAELKKKRVNYSIQDGCPPVPGLYVSNQTKSFNVGCDSRNNKILNYLLKERPKNLILVSRWNIYLNERDFHERHNSVARFVYPKGASSKENRQELAIKSLGGQLLKAITALKKAGVEVQILQQVPSMTIQPASYANKKQIFNQAVEFKRPLNEIRLRNQAFNRVIFGLNVKIIDLSPYFCDSSSCSPYGDKLTYYYDDDHLSIKGAKFCSPSFQF